jgi:RND superfamily putative drug exporter
MWFLWTLGWTIGGTTPTETQETAMFRRIITFATRHPKRVIALWAIVAIALASMSALFGYKVVTDDTAQFLPKGAESAQASRYAEMHFGQERGARAVTVVVKRADGGALTAADRAEVRALVTAMPRWPFNAQSPAVDGQPGDLRERAGHIVGAQSGPLAPDGRFQLVGLQWKANVTDPVAHEYFRQIRDRAADEVRGHELRVGFTGGVASTADDTEANEGVRLLSQALLFGAIIALSLLFFRGPLAAIVPLLAIYLVAAAASGLVVLAALAFGFDLDVGTTQLITVVLVGIGIDYFLFLLFRLREHLRAGEDRRMAAAHAAGAVGPVIASAAFVIVAAFATLGLAEFGQFRILGPAVSISVLVMLVAGVTLMPAIAAVTGRALFWPSRSWEQERASGPAARLGRLIARTPGRTAMAVIAVLVLLSTFALATGMQYDLGGGPSTPATRTADEISATLSKGAHDPQHVYVRGSDALTISELEPLRERLVHVPGVSAVGEPTLTPDRRGARIDVALTHDPMTRAAMDVVRGPLRSAASAAAPAGATTMVGGTAAIYADVSDSVGRDMRLILPVAAGLILLILVLTLRSAVAPLYLLAAVVLEFAATLGAAVLVFQQIGGEIGIAFLLPLTLFLFVVALGTDYNILMTARLREEMLAGRPVREAVAEAVRHVAPAVSAAGLVLASSFGTLMLESGEATRQQGFAMAFGILLASLVVSTILVPAVTAVVGRRAWWRPVRSGRAVLEAEA